jgi:hypothetical protein
MTLNKSEVIYRLLSQLYDELITYRPPANPNLTPKEE